MRVAVIGAGSMGGKHAQILAGLPDVDEVLVVDSRPSRAEAVAADVRGRPMDHDAALDSADAVIVATPAHLHAGSVDAAMAHGISVLCEKPLTESVASSTALVERVERLGAHVEVGFQRRHDPAFVAARQRVAVSGPIRLLRLTAFDPLVAPAEFAPNEAAPLFLHSSVHDFDFARWMCDSEVIEVAADGTGRSDARPADAGRVETAVVSMRMASGALAVLDATWLHPAGYDSRIEVIAERAHVTAGLSPRTPAEHLDWSTDVPAAPWSGYLERYEAAYRAELVAFLAAARGERPAASAARDGLEALRIAVAATRSYAERRTVALGEVDA
jgi:myo-inositol 2-dehydrogenase/D-chiro-inositol 1-dehydrogenase